MDNIDEQPIELFMDRNDLRKVYVRAGFMVGEGQTVEEALDDLRRHLSPEAKRVRVEKAWGTKQS
jgi:hypothetical protein